MSDVLTQAVGRWRSILMSLGVESRFLTKKHTPCPKCGGVDRFRWDDKQGRGTWICTHCGAGDGVSLLTLVKGWDFKECVKRIGEVIGAARYEQPTRETTEKWVRDNLNRTWRSAHLVEDDDPVARYLCNRKIVLPAWPREIRTCPSLRLDATKPPSFAPAMVARVTGPDGMPATLHRTYLSDEGTKAKIPEPKKLMPGRVPKGGSVCLKPPCPVMGVAEGIETALSAMILFGGLPVWSAINDSGLLAWEPPREAICVVIFSDNDQSFAGQAAAYGLAKRMKARGLRAQIEIPPKVGTDWNDYL